MAYSPFLFEKKTLTFENFSRFNALVNSRAFGSSLPSASLVPMADNFNHANKGVDWGLFNRQRHIECLPDSDYFLPGKFMHNVSGLYENCPLKEKLFAESKFKPARRERLLKNIQGTVDIAKYHEH
jgi:hypothetical protein